jgi:DNA-directed RNA polymerase-3 subunit RPC5
LELRGINPLVDQLHLDHISATYKFRTNLTYVDLHSQKTKRRRGEEEGALSDEAEEEEAEAKPRKGKALGEAKEVMVSARKTGESKFPTGMSDMRRELLRNLRAEELEPWVSLKYQDEVRHYPLDHFVPSLIPP